MEIFFDTLLTTDQNELITAALAIAHHVALQSPSKAAKDFLVQYHHAIIEDELFQRIDVACGELRAKRILACARQHGQGETA